MSVTSIIGPPFMSSLLHYFSQPSSEIYFPGAAMIAAAVLTLVSAVLARMSLKKNIKTNVQVTTPTVGHS
jgi:DHA1 family tetracycline resistance protein-like MFS transporter